MADSFPSQIGRYQVVRQLGRGGMGVVYLARDPFIERDVALKLLRSIDDEEAHGRFQREIRIAGALSHPNVVRIYDAGTHEEQPFVAMEYVAGETMAEVIKRGAPIDLDRKLELLLDLMEGLGYAHKRGVVHRDIKPSNLIIDEHGRLKILDFGIARLADAGRTSASPVGTPSYMAPEQIMGELVDARGDLFSCGIVVYEVVAYRLPFRAPSHHSLYNAILTADPAPLTSVAPGTPAALDTFIETALAKSPDRRFQTAQAFGDALRAVRSALSAEETVVVARRPKGSAPTPPVPDSGSGSGSAGGVVSPRSAASKRLAEMRDRQRAAAKEEARRALSEGRLADALEAAERALILDETDAGAQELAELARESMDRAEAGRLLEEAQKHLDTGELGQAQQVMQRLRAVKSGTPEFAALDAQLSRLQRELQLSRRRGALLGDVRRLVGLRDFEGAHGVLAEAMELGATGDDVLSLQATVEGGLRERQAEREWHARAREVTAQARELSERDQFDAAVALLEAFTPPHPEPTALLGDVRARQTQVADERRRRDREQQRQETRSRGLAEAEALLEAGEADAAIARLDGLQSQGIVDDAVEALEHRATDLRLAQANERRRAVALARGLDASRTAMARRDPGAALLVLEQLRADGLASVFIDALAADAEALQQQVARERQDQLERERRLARLAAGLQQVREALQRQDAEGASVALRFARQEGLGSPEIEDLERQTDSMLQELARQRQADVERERRSARLRDGVGRARAALDAGDPASAVAALGLLRREGFDQPELAALETEAQGLQQRTARERVEQLERERHDGRLEQGAERIRAAISARDFDAAFAALGLLRRDGFDAPELADLEREARALQLQVAGERYEQLERERRDARLTEGLGGVRRALAARDPEAAFATLGLLRRDGFDAPDFAGLEAEAQGLQQQISRERYEQLERERRAARLAEGLDGVRRALAARDPETASAALGLLRRDGFDVPDLVALEAEAQGLQQQAARERRAQLERERRDARLAQTLDEIRAALQRCEPDPALAALGLLRRDGFDVPDLAALETEAQELQQRIARERRAQLERDRRDARLAQALDEIRDALQRREPDPALAALGLLRRDGFDMPDFAALEAEAQELQQRIARERRAQLERERRDARLVQALDEIRAALQRREPDPASAALGLLRRDGFDTPDLAALEAEAHSLQQQITRERFERLERERRDARLAQALEEVRDALQRREPDPALAALGLLRRDGFGTPDLASLEAEAKGLQQRHARERYEQLERERRDARLAQALDEIRAALQRCEPDPALAALGLLRRDGFDTPEIATLQKEARALQQQIAHERFVQLERERRNVRLAEELADVRSAIERRDPDAAAAALGLLRRDGFDAEADGVQNEIKALEEDVARQRREHIEREGRASRLTRDAAQIRESLERRDPDAALAILEALQRDGLSLPDRKKLAKEARKLRDHLLHEQAAAAAESVQKITAAPTRTTPGAGTSRPRWLLPAAAVAVLIVGGAVGTWLMSRPAPVPRRTGPTTTVPAAASASAPSSVPAAGPAPAGPSPPPAAAGPPVEPTPAAVAVSALEQATRLERRGDLRGAARALSDLARKDPRSADATAANGRLRVLAVEARTRADKARQRAAAANASGAGEFAAGNRLFDQATRAAARGPALEAITGFLDAKAAFDRAAETTLASAAPSQGPAGTTATTSAPVPAPGPAPPTTPGTAVIPHPTVSPGTPGAPTAPAPADPPPAGPATSTVPVSGTSADQKLIEAAVGRYFAARSQLSLTAIQAVYPGVPADRERDQLRRVETACAEFSEKPLEVDVLRVAGSTATVQARVQTTCRPRAGKAQPSPVADITMTLEKVGDAYRITQVNRPDRAR